MSSHPFAFAAALVTLVGFVLTPGRPAMAEPEYRVLAGTDGGLFQPPFSNEPQSLSSTYSYSQPNLPQYIKRADAFARALPGQVGVNVHTVVNYPTANQFSPSGRNQADATAQVTLDDLIIVSETDPSQVGSVQGAFNVELSGFLSANAVATGGTFNATGRARVNFLAQLLFPDAIRIPGVFMPDAGLNTYVLPGALDISATSSAPAGTNSGFVFGQFLLENGFDGHEVFSTGIHTLPLGLPFGVHLNLHVDAYGEARAGGPPAASEFRFAEGAAGFGNTLGFPLDVDVFNLPEGFTAHSVSGRIVDNRFVPIPEPATISLLACGICALLLLRWRGVSSKS